MPVQPEKDCGEVGGPEACKKNKLTSQWQVANKGKTFRDHTRDCDQSIIFSPSTSVGWNVALLLSVFPSAKHLNWV